MSAIEALYIFDEHNNCILEHVWNGRPASAQVLLPLYLAHPAPQPSLIYIPDTSPPSLVYSIIQDRLLFLSPSSRDSDPLATLEFLHRVADTLEDFLGSPLLASKIESSYDVIAQLLGEMCDGGNIATTEPNALRDLVEAPSWMTKLLGGVGLPGSSPSLGPARPSAAKSLSSSSAVAIPWRRANVRHTSNEMYVDILETLHVTLSPSGRPLVASAHGTLAFTCKVSGIPDLFLKLAAPGGSLASLIQLPVFHPCVRLAHWRSRPGEFSFVPPDGRFLLAGYEVDLLGADYLERALANPNTPSPLQLPASVELRTGLGAGGAEFEARLLLNAKFAGGTREASFAKPALGGRTGGTSAHPVVEDVVVRVPIAPGVRNLTEVRASRGEAHYAPGDAVVEWRIAGKDTAALSGGLHSSASGVVATLRCGLVGGLEEEGETSGLEVRSETWEYDGEEGGTYQAEKEKEGKKEEQNSKRARAIQTLMPTSATVSFQVKGWLASGIKVEKLVIDTQRSKGLGAGVQPYKGVKYITVSKEGVEARA